MSFTSVTNITHLSTSLLNYFENLKIIQSEFEQTLTIASQETSPIPTAEAASGNIGNATLIIINHVNDSLAGNVKSSDFSMIVGNLNSTRKPGSRITQTLDFINGSESGISIPMIPGSFFVRDNQPLSKALTAGYNSTFSGDCHPFVTSMGALIGIGTIHAGQNSSCYINRILLHGK